MARRNNLQRPELIGEQNHEAKLTASEVEQLRRRYVYDGQNANYLAQLYRISSRHAYRIIRDQKWKQGVLTTAAIITERLNQSTTKEHNND